MSWNSYSEPYKGSCQLYTPDGRAPLGKNFTCGTIIYSMGCSMRFSVYHFHLGDKLICSSSLPFILDLDKPLDKLEEIGLGIEPTGKRNSRQSKVTLMAAGGEIIRSFRIKHYSEWPDSSICEYICSDNTRLVTNFPMILTPMGKS